MKKFLTIACIVLMVAVFTACASEDDKKSDKKETTTQETTTIKVDTKVENVGDDIVVIQESDIGTTKLIYHYKGKELQSIKLEATANQLEKGWQDTTKKLIEQMEFKVTKTSDTALEAEASEQMLNTYKAKYASKSELLKGLKETYK